MKQANDNQPKNDDLTNASKNKSADKKHSSALAAAAKGGRATENVKASSTSDVNGSSGTRNTGTNVNYDDKE